MATIPSHTRSKIRELEREAERAEAEAGAARAEWRHAVAEAAAEYGPTAVAKALGVSRGRIYQIREKAKGGS